MNDVSTVWDDNVSILVWLATLFVFVAVGWFIFLVKSKTVRRWRRTSESY